MDSLEARGLKRYALSWGATERERQLSLPCDAQVSAPDEMYWRAVDVRAPAGTIYRWLCQLRAAPYSDDWLDNFGRRSPRELIGGLDEIAVGQRVMTIFSVVAFERDAHLTVALTSVRARRIFGNLAVTYVVLPSSGDSSRLLAKVVVRYPRRAASGRVPAGTRVISASGSSGKRGRLIGSLPFERRPPPATILSPARFLHKLSGRTGKEWRGTWMILPPPAQPPMSSEQYFRDRSDT